MLGAVTTIGAVEFKDVGGKHLVAARDLYAHAGRAQQLGIGALRDQRFGQIQADLTLYFAGARSGNGGAQVNPAVIERGTVVFCLLEHRGIAG